MSETTLKARLVHPCKTDAEWASSNPVAKKGEIMISSDKSGMFKVGNGTSKWSELGYNHVTWANVEGKPSTYPATAHTHDDRYYTESEIDGKLAKYLPKSGGTMEGTAFISWPDTGNWSNSNTGVTFPVSRGGLQWSGQSDGIQLYAVETGGDNLELYLKFLDDNSNGLSIRNAKGNETARISASGVISASSFIGTLTGDITGHAYGVRDYNNSKNIIQIGYSGDGLTTANLSHIAGYTDNGTKIKDVSKEVLRSWIGLGSAAYTNSDSYAPSSHTHDDRYYTETEINDKVTALNNSIATKVTEKTITTATDFNTFTTTGIYHICVSTNSNLHAPTTNHGTLIVDFSVGTPYQIWIPDNVVDAQYKRTYTKSSSTWSGWTTQKLTDTVYTHPSYTAYTSGLYKITTNSLGHVTSATAVTKGDITALGIPGSNTDSKVLQTAVKASDYTNWRTILCGASNSSTEGFTPTTVTDSVFSSQTLTFQPSTGTLKANTFKGNLSGNASTATALTSSAGSATQPVYFSGGKPVACTYTLGKSVPSNAVFTDTNTWRGIQNNLTSDSTSDSLSAAQGKVLKGLVDGKANTSHTHTKSQITDFPSSMPASDVYSWAKASSKPSYSWSEINSKPSTFTPSSHTHTKSQITDFPSTMANPHSITIKLNGGSTEGSNLFTYNGSSAKSLNITASSIGAASSSHTHSYLPLSGGTVTGNTTFNNGVTIKEAGVELYYTTPFIDFHYKNDSSVDYTSRIIENASGVLNVNGTCCTKGGSLWCTSFSTDGSGTFGGDLSAYRGLYLKHAKTSLYLYNDNGGFVIMHTGADGNSTWPVIWSFASSDLYFAGNLRVSGTGKFPNGIYGGSDSRFYVNSNGGCTASSFTTDGSGTFGGGVNARLESTFCSGSYTDPLPGVSCGIKVSGIASAHRFYVKGRSSTWLSGAQPGGAGFECVNDTIDNALIPGWRIRNYSGAWVGASYNMDKCFHLYYAKAERLSGNTNNGTDADFIFNANTGNFSAKSITQTSDERRKSVISSSILDTYKDFFMKIKPFSFKWKDGQDDGATHLGVGAQSVFHTALECGFEESDIGLVQRGKEYPGTSIPWSVSYTEFIPLNIAVTQDHETRIEKLEAHASKLERENEELKQQIKELKGLTA